MNRYAGCKCFACGKVFTEQDDVVVCPDCGTPYHRECYSVEEGCSNTALHDNGGTWQEEQSQTGTEPRRCVRCGQENPPEGLFCNRCGMPLVNPYNNEPRPFNSNPYGNAYPPPYGQGNPYGQQGNPYGQQGNSYGQGNPYGQPGNPYAQRGAGPYGAPAMKFDQDSDIDGVKLGDYARYVGKNQFSFLTSFIRFAKFGGKVSINFPALLFPQFYFFYRKMPLIGALFMVVSIGLAVPTILMLSANGTLPSVSIANKINYESANFQMIFNATSSLLMGIQCLAAIFANYWYYKTAKKNITRIREQTDTDADEATVNARIAAKGGVSLAVFLFSVLLSNTLIVLMLFIMNKF